MIATMITMMTMTMTMTMTRQICLTFPLLVLALLQSSFDADDMAHDERRTTYDECKGRSFRAGN
jgi:hypothetical protein